MLFYQQRLPLFLVTFLNVIRAEFEKRMASKQA